MSITRKNAIITFDYEVFLGRRTGTIDNCVIKPTKLVLNVLKDKSAKAIFFVDATWLLFLKDNFFDDFLRISEQLKEIINSGSSVELHLHPQWLQAYKNGNEIVFESFKNYSLHSLSSGEIIELFEKSIDLLKSITKKDITCFRAGGFCIQPFQNVKEAFERFNIKYDFSVVPGAFLSTGKVYDFDFSEAPKLPYYAFGYNVSKPEITGTFTEIPMSSYRNNPAYRIVNKLLLKLVRDKRYGDGMGIQGKSLKSLSTFIGWLQFSWWMLSLDNTNTLFFKYLINFHFLNSEFLVFLSHPKTISPCGLANLRYVAQKYNTLNADDLNGYISTKRKIDSMT